MFILVSNALLELRVHLLEVSESVDVGIRVRLRIGERLVVVEAVVAHAREVLVWRFGFEHAVGDGIFVLLGLNDGLTVVVSDKGHYYV